MERNSSKRVVLGRSRKYHALFGLSGLNYATRCTGPIPPELAQLEDLRSLNLSENKLSGEHCKLAFETSEV